jgi:hypothetical protein
VKKATIAIGLSLVLLVIAAGYAWRNFPQLVQQQLARQFPQYGLQYLAYQQPQLSLRHFSAGSVRLGGVYNGLGYTAELSNLAVDFHWRSLLQGAVQMVKLDALEVSLAQSGDTPRSDSTEPTTVNLSRQLPGLLHATLPVDVLDIKRWQVTYGLPGRVPIVATGSLQLAQQLELQLQSSHLGGHLDARLWTQGSGAWPRIDVALKDGVATLMNVNTQASQADDHSWLWDVQAQLDFAPLLQWLRHLDTHESAVNLPVPEGLLLEGSSSLVGQFYHADTIDLKPPTMQHLLTQIGADIVTQNRIARLDYAGVLSGLAADLPVGLKLAEGRVAVTVGAAELRANLHTAGLSLSKDTLQWLGWGESIPLSWKNPQTIELAPLAGQSLNVQLRNNELQIGNQRSRLRFDKLRVDTSLEADDTLRGDLSLRGDLAVHLQQQDLPPLRVELSHSGSLEQSQFSVSLHDQPQTLELGLHGKGNVRSGVGSATANLHSQNLAAAGQAILPLLRKFGLLDKSYKLAVTAGRASLDSKIRSRGYRLDQLAQQSQFVLAQVTGGYNGIKVEEFGLSANWEGIDRWRTMGPARLSIGKLNAGFELRNIQAKLALPEATPIGQPTMLVKSFSSDVFGGRMSLAKPEKWGVGAQTNSATVDVQGWQLSQLVALQQNPDIQAQGVLHGQLPITINGGRLLIDKGYLRAQAPGGRIRYTARDASRAMAQSSSQLRDALEIMEDFYFDKLGSEVDLDASGNLLLSLALAGSNPDYSGGRRINFNLNLAQNIDPLLQSLRLSGSLARQLEDRVE